MGEAISDAAADVQSVYAEGDSDVVSSDGLNHVSGPASFQSWECFHNTNVVPRLQPA